MQRYLFIFVFITLQTQAQQALNLRIEYVPSTGTPNIRFPSQIADSSLLSSVIHDIQIQLVNQGLLAAQIIDLAVRSDSVILVIQTGKPFRWISLRQGNVPDELWELHNMGTVSNKNQRFNPTQFAEKTEDVLNWLESNGYPFAGLALDSFEFEADGIRAAWKLDFNRYIQFDTLELIGTVQVKKWFLHKYTGIGIGQGYADERVRQAAARLSQLPYITVTRESSVYFYGNRAKPILFLDDRKSSSVDGIIGFAPNTQSQNKELLITGEANLKLQNLFETGKSLELNYRSFLGNSQDLRIKADYPYVFRSNLGVDYELNVLKQDSSFLDVKQQFGLPYRFIGSDHIRVFYGLQTTSLITVDTSLIRSRGELPEASDIRSHQYGLSAKWMRYDYFLNPRKGMGIDIQASVGTKTINRNPTVESVRFYRNDGSTYSVYDSIPLSMIQYRIYASADYFVPIKKFWTLRIQCTGAVMEAPRLFANELFRIGGIRTLKGFDEQAIFASRYMIANTELRYLIQKNAHLALFWNGAWYANTVRNPVLSDRPYGFGAGMNFETPAGIFSMYYAVGKAFQNPIEWEKAKIHFGFTNLF